MPTKLHEMPALIPRHVAGEVTRALQDTRVVSINGARQVGKSTLAAQVLAGDRTARLLTLDDEPNLAAARADPVSFIRHDGTLLIDEVQRAPELFLPIKAAVDRNRAPGQFLLTGSAQVLALPRLADSLAGRMEIVELWPFSQGEIGQRRERFVDTVLEDPRSLTVKATLDKRAYLELAIRGGFPEAVARSAARRSRWFESYLKTLIQRDIRDVARIERLDDLPRILRLIAARTANVLNLDSLARDSRVPPSTLRRYLTLLETTFLIRLVPSWSNNKTTRVVRASKIFFTDTGLAAHLLGATASGLSSPTGNAGQILENLVVMEIQRQLGWSEERATLHHMRTKEHVEVDAVIEAADGRIAGIEVKAASTVRASDFGGLRYLAEKAGARFVAGVVLYTGTDSLSFSDKMFARPLSALWDAK